MQPNFRDKIINIGGGGKKGCDGFQFRPFVISILLFVFHRYLLVDYCRPKRIMYFLVDAFLLMVYFMGELRERSRVVEWSSMVYSVD